jgi:hypothetical protein
VLVLETSEQLQLEPPARQFWHLAVLMALRDRAEQVEVRFTESAGVLYHRVEGRDWEVAVVPESVLPELKPVLRAAARLVDPERPEVTVTAGLPEARFEPRQVGWLTYQIRDRLIDLVVRIDPREPWGGITLVIEYPDEQGIAGLAADALAAYYERE